MGIWIFLGPKKDPKTTQNHMFLSKLTTQTRWESGLYHRNEILNHAYNLDFKHVKNHPSMVIRFIRFYVTHPQNRRYPCGEGFQTCPKNAPANWILSGRST